MITQIEDYFSRGCGRCSRFDTADCSVRTWASGMHDLRRICLASGLTETVKWGHPCYTHAGRNIVILGAFRGDFRISFFDAALMQDPESILTRQGPNTPHPDTIRFTDSAAVAGLEPVLRAYIAQAMGHAAAGIKPPKVQPQPDLPEELVETLEGDPELAQAFYNLTPGRQKSYALNLRAAKASATRHARIARFRDKIFAGKGAQER